MIHNILSTIDLDAIVEISKKAGLKILEVYNNPRAHQLTLKTDNSPVTAADIAAHNLIFNELKRLYPDIPVISEEGPAVPYEIRANWLCFWVVDPLDGTREFMNRNGEFTVNIALVINNKPVLGVIHAPALGQTFSGSLLHGASKETAGFAPKQIGVKPSNRRVAVRSRSHGSAQEEKVLAVLGAKECLQVGSSLKFCLVADGVAAYYYRHAPTMEWDTAAGQAIVEAAGGSVTTPDRLPLLYNKKTLRNGSFLCMA